jgi:hypothetical protein
MHHNVPISFKVPKKQAEEAREIVKLVSNGDIETENLMKLD